MCMHPEMLTNLSRLYPSELLLIHVTHHVLTVLYLQKIQDLKGRSTLFSLIQASDNSWHSENNDSDVSVKGFLFTTDIKVTVNH